MASKEMSALQSEQVAEMDDFKIFPGIGPGVEHRLHAAGIITYQQLASLSPEDIARILSDMVGFSVERIIQQDWIGQAQQVTAEQQDDHATNQQHYAVFTLELLLDKDNAVRRTRLMHVQSQKEETWAGWDEKRLIHSYKDLAGLRVQSHAEQEQNEFQAPTPQEISVEHQPGPPVMEGAKAKPAGQFRLSGIEIQTQQPRTSRWMLPGGQSVTIRLKLDLSELQSAGDFPLNYSAVLYAKEMSTGSRLAVGSSKGTINQKEDNIIEVDCLDLQRGTHRLDAFVMLSPVSREPRPDSSLIALLDGGLFQVY